MLCLIRCGIFPEESLVQGISGCIFEVAEALQFILDNGSSRNDLLFICALIPFLNKCLISAYSEMETRFSGYDWNETDLWYYFFVKLLLLDGKKVGLQHL